MSGDDRWIITRISEARERHPLVTEAVSSRMVELLKGQLREQQLSRRALASVAKALIADMAAAPPRTDTEG